MSNQDRSRVQKGVPTGGQFSAEGRNEVDVELDEASDEFEGRTPLWKQPDYWRNVLRPVLSEARADALSYEAHVIRSQALIDSGKRSPERITGRALAYYNETAEGCRRAADLIRDTPPDELQDRLAELAAEYTPPGASNYIRSYARMLRGSAPPPSRYFYEPGEDGAGVNSGRMGVTAAQARDDAVMLPPHGPGRLREGSYLYLDPDALNEAAEIMETSKPNQVVEKLEVLHQRVRGGEASRFVKDYICEVQGLAPEYNGPLE